jgi:hypothetical protein
MIMKKVLVPVVAVISLGASSLFGSQIVQTKLFANAPTDITDAQSVQTFLDFGNFATPAGSILNSVTFEVIIGETITALSIQNTSLTGSETYDYETSGKYSVNGTANATDVANITNALGLNHLIFSTGPVTIGAGGTQVFSPPNLGILTDTGVVGAASVAPYAGVGTYTLSFDTLTGETFFGGGGNEQANQATNSNATFVVTYNYTAGSAPEPGTITLLGSALLGIGFMARKHVKKG